MFGRMHKTLNPVKVWKALESGDLHYIQKSKNRGLHELRDTTWGETILHYTAYLGHLNILQYLMNHVQGFDVHDKGTVCGTSLLHSAAAGGNPLVLRYLLEETDLDVNAKANNGVTPLYSAATRDHYACCQLLLAAKADPDLVLPGYTKKSLCKSLETYYLLTSHQTPLLELQIVSDVHTEFVQDLSLITDVLEMKPVAPYLALLGDIGIWKTPTYELFIEQNSKLFKRIFLLAGNHEYYKSSVQTAKAEIKKICDKFPNVDFLDGSSVEVDGVKIIGATLWSYVNDQNKAEITRTLNDYHQIFVEYEVDDTVEGMEVENNDASEGNGKDKEKTNGGRNTKRRLLTVDDTVQWHKQEVKFIASEIEDAKSKGMRM